MVLDNRNTKDLGGMSGVRTYECSRSKADKFFRFIRTRQAGKNNSCNGCLMLNNIEFFEILKRR
jgi:hypothetical protein